MMPLTPFWPEPLSDTIFFKGWGGFRLMSILKILNSDSSNVKQNKYANTLRITLPFVALLLIDPPPAIFTQIYYFSEYKHQKALYYK
jgi:hypothetical protein